MNKKNLAYANFVVILFTFFWNFYVFSKGKGGAALIELSQQYDTLITPADYAFGIWTLIFIGLIALGIRQIQVVTNNLPEDVITPMGYWLIVANICNCLWLSLWVKNQIGFSVVIMIILLVSLLQIIVNLKMQLGPTTQKIEWFTWLPISLYAGWITVATVVNIAAFLTSKNVWQGNGESIIAAIILGVATYIYGYMLYNRNMYAYTLVGVWAFIAIAVKQWGANALVQWTAAAGAIILLVAVIYYWNQNRTTVSS